MENVRENKMGIMPVGRLVISMSLPIMASMLVQALYNVVDSIFVARYSEAALTAVSLAFPAQNLMIAIGVGTGVGINALLSRYLGEKNFDRANSVAKNGVFLALMSYLLFLVLGLTVSRTFFELQTTDKEVIQNGADYLFICFVFSFGVFGQIVFERLMQSTGKTIYTMYTQGLGAIINIILDPIFIFGLLGMPEMGAKGAAVATVIGQIAAMLFGVYLNQRKNPEIQLKFRGFHPSWKMIKRIYSIGLPSIVMNAVTSVMTFSLNTILYGFGVTAVNVMGIYFKLQSFVFMPVFGLNNGLVPIISYNYGAENRKRVIRAIKFGFGLAFGMLLTGFLIFQFFSEPILRALFDASDKLVSVGVPALRIISISFIAAAFSIITISVLQSLGRGVSSLIISLVRQIGLLIPVAYLMSLTGNVNAVWFAFPVAETGSVICAMFMFVSVYRKIIKKIGLAQ